MDKEILFEYANGNLVFILAVKKLNYTLLNIEK